MHELYVYHYYATSTERNTNHKTHAIWRLTRIPKKFLFQPFPRCGSGNVKPVQGNHYAKLYVFMRRRAEEARVRGCQMRSARPEMNNHNVIGSISGLHWLKLINV